MSRLRRAVVSFHRPGGSNCRSSGDDDPPVAKSSLSPTTVETLTSLPGRSTRKKALTAAAGIAIVLIVTLILLAVRERIFGRPNLPDIQSIAVLPLKIFPVVRIQTFLPMV